MDGVYGTVDKGAVPAITDIVKDARCPIVLTANDFWDKKFVAFRDKKKYLVLEFKKPPAGEVLKHLQKICAGEGIEAEEQALKFIAQRSEGDVRSAVNDLQALAQGKTTLTYDDVSWLAYRDRKDVIFNILGVVLYGKTCDTAKRAVDSVDVDPDMLFEWIYENTPYHFNVPRTHPEHAGVEADPIRDRLHDRGRRDGPSQVEALGVGALSVPATHHGAVAKPGRTSHEERDRWQD
jgi:replication factor C large subunit